MFTDLMADIKDGIILHLSRNDRLTQFLPVEHIFGMQPPPNPPYPYLRFGTPIATPYVASCWQGTQARITLDLFAQGGPDAPAGETQVMFLVRLLVEAMNDLDLGSVSLVDNSYLGANYSTVDNDADRHRAMVEFNITAVILTAI